MTVDSTYFPQEIDLNNDKTQYQFEIESIGDEAMQIWVELESGEFVRVEDIV